MRRRNWLGCRYTHDYEAAVADIMDDEYYRHIDRAAVPRLVRKHARWSDADKRIYDENGWPLQARTTVFDSVAFVRFEDLEGILGKLYGYACVECGTVRGERRRDHDDSWNYICRECFWFRGDRAWTDGLPSLLRKLKKAAREAA